MKMARAVKTTMNKKINTFRKLAYVLVAATALSACASEEPEISGQTGQEAEPLEYTMTLEATKLENDGLTRALNLEDKTLKTTWAEGEKVYVLMYDYETGKWDELGFLEAKASDDCKTHLKGTLNKVPVAYRTKLHLHNPGVDYRIQDGSLEKIATDFDYATAWVTDVEVKGNTIKAEASEFISQQAIVKFTFIDQEGNIVPVYDLTIEDNGGMDNKGNMWQMIRPKNGDGNQDEHVFGPVRVIDNDFEDGVVYVALSNVAPSSKLKMRAVTRIPFTDLDFYPMYTYTKTGVHLEKGKYYSITVKMNKMTQLGYVEFDYKNRYIAKDGEILTGSLLSGKQLLIENDATVTLDDVSILGENNEDYRWAGITCQGNATIILDGTNTVQGYCKDYPGIFVPSNNGRDTLTIKGEGELIASSNGSGAGIGSGISADSKYAGNIVIKGGVITATGGEGAAGIGSARGGRCYNITISGGTVTAIGGLDAAGIGTGESGECNYIHITKDVNKVIAVKGSQYAYSIGRGVNGWGASTIIDDDSKVEKR